MSISSFHRHQKRRKHKQSKPMNPARQGFIAVFVLLTLFGCHAKMSMPTKKAKDSMQRARANYAPVRRAVMAPSPKAAEKASSPALDLASSGKKSKKKKDKPLVKAWKRTAKGTMLSKVSVGGGRYLKLDKLRVTVQVQGMRVRTILDHIYHNPYPRTLQGTFKYTLPPDASVSYYAMFVGQQRRRAPRFFTGKAPQGRDLVRVRPQQIAASAPRKEWGRLREARLVPAIKGRQVYEKITRRRIDPALLEQVAPNTFSGRVFPIQSRGYNRVILAYEQTLPQLAGRHVYRFRFPPDIAKMIDFSMDFDPKLAALQQHNLRANRCRAKAKGGFLRCIWESNRPDRDAIFYFAPRRQDAAWVAGFDPLSQQRYLHTQLRIKLPKGKGHGGQPQALFLLDTSLSANPDLFGAHVMLLKQILEKNKAIKRFNVLFFDVAALWANPKGWIENTPAQRTALFQRIDKILLEGATNLQYALGKIAQPVWLKGKGGDVDLFMLSDGQVSWGERETSRILGQFRKLSRWKRTRIYAYRMGLGSENIALMRQITRSDGAVFPCLGRAEIARCATAHTQDTMRLENIEIKGVGAKEVMVAGRQGSLYHNALVQIAARYQRDGKAQITLRGTWQGKAHVLRYQLPLKAKGDLAPRAWAEMAIQQLLEFETPELNELVVAYAQHFHIPNKHCSLLVLETDKEYKQYGLEQQRKQKRVTDLALFLQKLHAAGAKLPDTRARWRALLTLGLQRGKKSTQRTRAVMAFLNNADDAALQFPPAQPSKVWQKEFVSKAYQQAMTKHGRQFDAFIDEARRRASKAQVGAAVRALSCIVERHPSDPRALRMVGYNLLNWNRPSTAAWTFLQVLERRPYEPQAYRDLARAMLKLRRYGLAAALYEVILAGRWDSRFGRVTRVAREEYALFVQEALKSGKMNADTRALMRQRKAMLGLRVKPAKLRVTLTWNTDNTDIDLWVVEPTGEKCYYSKKRTSNGGRLLEDLTRGYGPERYENRGGRDGQYRIKLKYYGHRANTFGNQTYAQVTIVKNAGTPQQEIIEKNLTLRRKGNIVQVSTVKF